MRQWWQIHFRPDWLTASFLLVLALGAALRLVGTNFDLPLITHPDEPKVVAAVIDLIERRSFEPTEFTWPAHVVIMAGYIASNIYAYIVFGTGPEAVLSEQGAEHWYLATRIAVALIGSFGIALAYAIGSKLRREIGVVGATLVAFFPIFVGDSHLATSDITLSVTVMAVILAAMFYLESPRYPALFAMSFFVAMSIATKYPGLIAAGMIAVVVGIRAWTDRNPVRFVKHGFVSLFGVVVSLFIISPVLFTDRHMVFRSVGNESKVEHLGSDGLNYVEKLGYYWSQYYGATGWLLLLPFVVGLIAIVRFRLVIAVPIFTGVIFWLVLSFLALHWTRWGMPMYITPLLVSAIGVFYLFDAVSKKLQRFRRAATVSLVGLSVLATANLLATSVAVTSEYLVPDTRAIATEEFKRLGITETNSVYEGYTVHNTNVPMRVFQYFNETDGELVPLQDFDYVVISSSMFDRYMADDRYQDEQRFYTLLEDSYPLVAEFSAERVNSGSGNPFVNIAMRLDYIGDVAQGKVTTGPTIKVFAVQ